MHKNISILDCTLRDGGFALEDAEANNTKTKLFNKNLSLKFLNEIKNSKIEIIEVGAVEISKEDKKKFNIYKSIESLSKIIPKNSSKNMYAAMFRGPDIPEELIPKWQSSLCKNVRVIIRYSEIKKSLDFCGMLSKKGYNVFVQPMVTSRYKYHQIKSLINACNKFKLYALYIVDSYGLMKQEDVLRYFKIFNNGLKSNIKIGFHGHNNMNMAFSNAIALISENSKRSIIIDSSIMGMGQGAGNLQTELLTNYLNYKKKYKYKHILEACEIIEKFLDNNLWGYSVKNLIPAINNTAYKYSSYFKKKYNFTYSQINQILGNIPKKIKDQFTTKNAQKLLNTLKK